MAINRIAGQTLQSELLRDGENIAFQDTALDTPVLQIDIGNSRVGINTDTPTVALHVVGNIQSNNITVTGNVIPTANITYTLGNVTNQWANVYANLFVGNVSGNVSGNITVPGSNTQIIFNNNNIAGASAGLTFDSVANLLTSSGNINGGNLTTTGTANVGTLAVTGNVSGNLNVTGNIAGGNILTPGLISATANITGGNLNTSGQVQTNNLTSTGTSNLGNISIANSTIGTSTANANIVIDPNGTGLAVIDTTTGLVLPVGNTAQQPSPGTTGTIRFNTTTSLVEVYNGSSWANVNGPAITNQVIVPDGTSNAYTLDRSTTAASIIVSINGLVQIPGASYSYTVSGTTITFADVPLTTDIIDIRFL